MHRPIAQPRSPRAAVLLLLAAASLLPALTGAPGAAQTTVEPSLYEGLEWRMIGPYRGGRSTAVTGVPSSPGLYFMGTTGGGMWKSDDFGTSWEPISDDDFGGSIGAVDVSEWDPNVIYVGMGSVDIRGNTSVGRGVWKSMDQGRTWAFKGLPEAGQIGRIEVHPKDPDLVYVAALGHAFGKNPERGVYRSRDGGDTWQHVLALSDSTGAADLTMSPSNPRVLFAGMWRGERKPWTLISGAEEGGVYRTTDGGDNWEKLAGGLPTGIVGKVGVSVSPADPDRVWAIIEAEPDGGVYRSDDGGESWTRTNSENNLRQRAWYYTHVQADPQDANTVYALNTGLYRSVDGGTTFESIQVPHGDIHDLWIDALNPDVMIVADDGGAQVTVNAGRSWSTYYNQPTAELYDVIVDNGFPYRVYGAQQDNTGISVPAWTPSSTLHPKEHWQYPSACETGPVALHPDNPRIVYGGCYGGAINRLDMVTGQRRNVVVYPQLQLGQATRDLRERFQWVSPIVVSPHDENVVYHASQRIHRTTDGGMTWQTISGDLSTDNPDHQAASGGPINHDVTGVEIYNVVFSVAVSPHTPDVIWAGTDDGRVHITRDGGASWNEITPPDMPELGTVDEIDPSVHVPGRAVMAVQKYRIDDFGPYVFITDDYGESWRLAVDGIPGDFPVRTVREDPDRQGLLYAGTEFGIFVSFDDGGAWQSLQLDLPVTPVTGMRVAHEDLIISTQGRSFYILDDITPLHEADDGVDAASPHLFAPRGAYRVDMAGCAEPLCPEARPGGAMIHYYLPEDAAGTVAVQVVDGAGGVVRTWSSDEETAELPGYGEAPAEAGMHRIVWDLTYPGPELDDGAVVWGYTGGVKAPPGSYAARLTVDGSTMDRSFEVLADPRIPEITTAEYAEQFRVGMEVRDSLNAVHGRLAQLRDVREQIDEAAERAETAGHGERVGPVADSVKTRLETVEILMNQVLSESGQDPIRHAGQLDNQYLELYGFVTGVDGYIAGGPEGRPSAGALERMRDLHGEWTGLQARLVAVFQEDVAGFNRLMEELGIPAIVLDAQGRPIT